MQAIVFNFSKSYLHQKVEAVTLKAGHLLSSKICSAGTICYDICINEKKTGSSLFEKLDFLEHVSQNNTGFNKEVKSMRALMKRVYEAGHETRGQLVRRKEGEDLIHMTYQSFFEIYQNTTRSYGLQELKELFGDNNFSHYPMNKNPEDSTGGRIKASDLLQRLLSAGSENEDEEPEIFLLGPEFLIDDYDKPNLYQVTDADALCNDTIFLHHCFTLYGINELTSDELRSIHYDSKQPGTTFHDDVNQWIDMCYFDNNVPERLTFFKDRVLPASVVLQQKIDANQILRNDIRLQENALQTEVWLGEMPVLQLWNYYRNLRVIKNKTWEKLQRLQQDEAFREQRWPVMMLRIPEAQLQLLQADEETSDELIEEQNTESVEEIKATRKYISID